jgi:hypothetical protein
MADPPTTNHIANSNTAVAATSADNMTESTNAQSGATLDTAGIEPTPFAKSNTPTSTISTTEQEAAPTPAESGTPDLNTLEANPWPRLHLLGLPRELRDKIYKHAIVSDEPVFIGPTDKCFVGIPPLTETCRQLRRETHRMFLEQNTLEINEDDLMTIQSSTPFNIFKALCAGSELQKISMDSSRLCGRRGEEVRVEIMADLVVVKTSDGLEVSLPGLLSDCTASYKICACRIERLANEHGGQNGAVVRFLEALRQDWMDHSYDKCNDSRCESEDDEHDNCVFGHNVEFCDIHPARILY